MTNFSSCFEDCEGFTTIPTNLFKYNIEVTDFSDCFDLCDDLQGFDIYIGSTKVKDCSYFVHKNTKYTRIVRVPAGSTTADTFKKKADSLGITVIEY